MKEGKLEDGTEDGSVGASGRREDPRGMEMGEGVSLGMSGGEDEKDGKAGGWTVKSRVGWKEGGGGGGGG